MDPPYYPKKFLGFEGNIGETTVNEENFVILRNNTL